MYQSYCSNCKKKQLICGHCLVRICRPTYYGACKIEFIQTHDSNIIYCESCGRHIKEIEKSEKGKKNERKRSNRKFD